MVRPRKPLTPDDPRHGTMAGYTAHRRAGEQPCLTCYDAENRYNRFRRYVRTGKERNHCGTEQGWICHRSQQEDPCDACAKAKAQADSKHGTAKAYNRHRYLGEKVCAACNAWRSKDRKDRYISCKGNCACEAGKKRREEQGWVYWDCQGCGEVWHSQPEALPLLSDDWQPPPKVKHNRVLKPKPEHNIWDGKFPKPPYREERIPECGTIEKYIWHINRQLTAYRVGKTCRVCEEAVFHHEFKEP